MFVDDEWSRPERYFTTDVIYETLGDGGERFAGRPAMLAALRRSVRALQSSGCDVAVSWQRGARF